MSNLKNCTLNKKYKFFKKTNPTMFLRSPKHFKDGKQIIFSHKRIVHNNYLFKNINNSLIFFAKTTLQKLLYPVIWHQTLPEFIKRKIIIKNNQKIKFKWLVLFSYQ